MPIMQKLYGGAGGAPGGGMPGGFGGAGAGDDSGPTVDEVD